MPIDVDKKLIFIHIPKTGGTSVETVFGMTSRRHLFSMLPDPELQPLSKSPQHFTYRELEQNLSSEFFTSSYTFSFVRNPWDRLVSEFSWRQRYYLRWFRNRSLVFDRRDLESIDKFVRMFDLPEADRVDAIRGFDGHLETQTSFLVDRTGNLAPHRIGRFESFEKDLMEIAARCGVAVVDLPRLNKGSRSDYRQYYTSYSRSAVESFYAEDIDRFGYTF